MRSDSISAVNGDGVIRRERKEGRKEGRRCEKETGSGGGSVSLACPRSLASLIDERQLQNERANRCFEVAEMFRDAQKGEPNCAKKIQMSERTE